MRLIYVVTVLLTNGHYSEGFPIRLWPTNLQGTEGFVEALYSGSWGFVGNPELQFTDATATFLCKTLGLSQFGYGSGWTSMENYTGHSWLYGLECYGNETSIEQCMRQYSWEFNNYTSQSSWQYLYGSRLYCVDSKLTLGETENTGVVHSVFSGQIYTICYDGFDMNAANVVCNHLRYNGSVNFTKSEPGSTPIYSKYLNCDGNEHSLTECQTSSDIIENCSEVVHITCRAVRLTQWNKHNNEGAVEIYHNGSWGFIGDPAFSFNDVTAKYLCETFGFESGFSTTAHPLDTYYRKSWLSSLTCTGQESHIMQCEHPGFSYTPSLMNTYKRGTWLYCFDFNMSSLRLVNGSTSYEGKVELEVGGRWGSICTYAMSSSMKESSGDVVCKFLGYAGIDKILEDKIEFDDELIWMSYVSCDGTVSSLMDCSYTKGPITPCYDSPVTLAVQCIDIDECLSSPCLNGGSCENGDQSYVCQCSNTTKWGGTNCEIDLEHDACAESPCLNAGSCVNLIPEGFECVCAAGFEGDICQINIDECKSFPCGNGGRCLDLVNGYKCVCLLGYTGLNCQTNIDECSSSPCKNDGICEDLISEFKCHCANSFEGNFCEKEIKSHTTLIAILVSAACLLVIGIVLIGCFWLMYRRKQTKIKSKGKPKPNKDDDACQTSTVTEQEGSINIYHSVKENDAFETDHDEVYAEIKEGEFDDYLTPASAVGPAKDDDGYLTFGNDERSTVRYYNLKDTKHDDYSKLSRPETLEAE